MRIVISEFMSLDGVCQAPGGPEEDLDGGFRHFVLGLTAPYPANVAQWVADEFIPK